MSEPQRPTRSRWRQRLHNWVTRGQVPGAEYTLGHRNIYVLPSAAGCMLAATLLVLLVASINFQLNLGYLLTFLIAGSALASVWVGHRNLQGLQLHLGPLQPVFQGERATVPLHLQAPAAGPHRHGLSVALNRSQGPLAWVHADVAAGHTQVVELGSVPHQRGWHRVPRVVLESRYPLGVFRLWSYWQPDGRVLVYPCPETPAPPIQHLDHAHSGTSLPQPSGMVEPDNVRHYQRGDSLRSIVWKKAASALALGHGDLVVRSGTAPQADRLWLDARATGLTDPEAQIARLTAWVLQAHAQQALWGLRLPSGQQLPQAMGEPHLHACLAALAVDGKSAAPH
jgi:uncharacterized protein (DUF58 family)